MPVSTGNREVRTAVGCDNCGGRPLVREGGDAYQAHKTTLHIEVARDANPFTLVGIVFLGGCGCAQVTGDGFCVPGIQETASYLDVGYL